MSTETVAKREPRRRRARRKLSSPLNLALAAILIALVAFWLGGMLQDDSSGSAMPTIPSGMGGPPSGSGSGGGSATRGEITSLDGNTLYVSSGDGTTVKVKVKRNAAVTRNANVKASGLHPGDTVTVSGKKDKAGVVKADSVTATQSGVETAMPSFGGTADEHRAPTTTGGRP